MFPNSAVSNQQRPASSSTSTGSGTVGQQAVVGPGGVLLALRPRLDLHTDKRKVIQAMAMPVIIFIFILKTKFDTFLEFRF